MLLLNIKYSKKLEEQRIEKTLERLSWYDKLGYRPRFPEKINPRKDSLKKIKIALEDEFNEKDYKKTEKEILRNFSKVENFCNKLKNVCGKNAKKEYEIILTRYGVGGSYSLPNRIILNINSKSKLNTILHEITHLMIEKYILKHNIEQNQKERIVDLILKSKGVSLRNYKMQERGKNHKENIDGLFKKYFKSPIGNFFRKIEEIRQ